MAMSHINKKTITFLHRFLIDFKYEDQGTTFPHVLHRMGCFWFEFYSKRSFIFCGRVNHFLFLFPPKFTLECKHEEQWRRSLGLDAGRIQMGKCPLSGHPPSPWGPLWDNSCKIKGQQHHSRPARKSKLSQRSVSQADGGAKPSWVIYAYSRGYTLLKAHDTFISSCMWCWNLHLLLPSHFHRMWTRKVRASPFITHAEKMQCELGHHLQPHRNPGLTPRLSIVQVAAPWAGLAPHYSFCEHLSLSSLPLLALRPLCWTGLGDRRESSLSKIRKGYMIVGRSAIFHTEKKASLVTPAITSNMPYTFHVPTDDRNWNVNAGIACQICPILWGAGL